MDAAAIEATVREMNLLESWESALVPEGYEVDDDDMSEENNDAEAE